MGGFPWLTVITFLPLAGAAALVAFPSTALRSMRWWSLLITVATLGLCVGMLSAYSTNAAGFQLALVT